MRAAGDQVHFGSAARQGRAHVRADRPRAEHRDLDRHHRPPATARPPSSRSTDITGPSATCPSPQMLVRRIVSSSSSMRSSTSAGPPPRSSTSARICWALWDPTRHGHALAAGLVAKEVQHVRGRRQQVGALRQHDHRARAQRRSRPRRPRRRSAADRRSRGRGSSSTRRRAAPHPPPAPSRTPPASAITSTTSVPAGTQNTPGCSTCPETEKNFNPPPPLTPCSFHHPAPRSRMTGTAAKVSTLFINVGRPCSP